MENWIGKVKLSNGKQAVLNEKGEWSSEDVVLQDYLNLRFRLKDNYSMGLPSGWSTVSAAAEKLKGEPVFPHKLKPLPKGCIS